MKRNSYSGGMDRRTFLRISALAAAGTATGCAINPVTGKRQLMLMSKEEEIELDQAYSPHQFSSDFGAVQDAALNQYLSEVGTAIAALSHRPGMPYSFRVVNAVYVNAYAFPGGSIATTRGILLDLEDEAELAALLGHEIGHVNARHTAEQMTKQMLLGAAIYLGAAVVASKNEKAAPWIMGLGSIATGALLAHYSRDDEREADSLGMEYMTRAGYNPQGMVGLMDLLRSMSDYQPDIIEKMFSTHPMSDERYNTAVKAAKEKYITFADKPMSKERYMDRTASLRKLKAAIRALQTGEQEMAEQKYAAAETQFKTALKVAPRDYTGLVMMGQCQMAQEKYAEGDRYLAQARQAYPAEPMSVHMSGLCKLMQKQYEPSYAYFSQYESMLPGNPNTIFLKGYTQENMKHIPESATEYQRFLQQVTEGEEAEHARLRLTEWGYIKKEQL